MFLGQKRCYLPCQGYKRRRGQGPVGIDSRKREPQRILLTGSNAGLTTAFEVVRSW